MIIREYRNFVRVLETSDDVVRVRLVDEAGKNLADGLSINVPASVIPKEKQRVGTMFRLRWSGADPEEGDTPASIREAVRKMFLYLDDEKKA